MDIWVILTGSPLQCISVLKLLFDRMQNINETAHINVDIGRLVLFLARYIHRSGTSPNALRVKMKFAGLLDSLFVKRDLLPLRKEVSLRNTLLDMVAEWAFDAMVSLGTRPLSGLMELLL